MCAARAMLQMQSLQTEPAMSLSTHCGSCHCGAVRFEADIDLAEGTAKCNCTSCWKRRWWSLSVPPERFRDLGGAAALSDFHPGQDGTHGGFCRHCGVHVYGYVPASEWNPEARVAISVSAFDDLDPAEIAEAPVTYQDGLHDNWWNPPAETRHL
jgi:hypothetical protein